MVAANLMGTTTEFAAEDDLAWKLASSGFRDTSRLASSDVRMMLDILMTNSENVAHMMRSFSRRFAELADAIYDHDEESLRALLADAALKRREWKGS
jgi:prephenate dehydrogenase